MLGDPQVYSIVPNCAVGTSLGMERMRRFMKMQTSTWIGVFAVLHVLSIFLFIKGFLLTRFELPNISACDTGSDQIGRNVSGCWSDARYDRVVLVVLDALRYDFVVEDGNMPGAMHVEQLPKLLALREEAVSMLFTAMQCAGLLVLGLNTFCCAAWGR